MLELISLLQGQRVRFGDDRDHIDDLCKLLEYDNIDLRVNTIRLDPVQNKRTGFKVCPVGLMKNRQQWIRVSAMCRSRRAVNSFRRYAECWSLIWSSACWNHGPKSCTHVFDNRIPAIIVVDLVPIPRRINDVQLQPYSILSNDCNRQLDPL